MNLNNKIANSYPIPPSKAPLWDADKIQAYFAEKELPETLKLDEITTITNVPGMVKAHMAFLRANDHKPTFKPYHDRLLNLAKLCQ